ncbi:MAG: hypothetical protein ACJAYU_005168, partial [Bradymonadia bacterium]
MARDAPQEFMIKQILALSAIVLVSGCSDSPVEDDPDSNSVDVADDVSPADSDSPDAQPMEDVRGDTEEDIAADSADVVSDPSVALDTTLDPASDVIADITDIPDAEEDAFLPSPGAAPFGPGDIRGPYNVGYRQIELTYSPRSVDETRTIPVSLWYPTLAREGRVSFYAD